MCVIEKELQIRILHHKKNKHTEKNEPEIFNVTCNSFHDLLLQLKIRWGKTKLYSFYDSDGQNLSMDDFDCLSDSEFIYASPAHRPFAVTNYLEDYDIIQKLGSGGFGIVYQIKHKYTGAIRALKIIRERALYTPSDFSLLFNEVKVMTELTHESIVKFYSSFSCNGRIVIIMEYIQGKSLRDWIESVSPNKIIPEEIARCIIKQLLEVIDYCHKHKYVHHDKKLDRKSVV